MITKFSTSKLTHNQRSRNLLSGIYTSYIATLSDATANTGESVTFDASGNAYVGGRTQGATYTNELMAAIDTTGSLSWQKSVASIITVDFKNTCVAKDSSGVYFGGWTYNNSWGVMNVLNVNYAGTLVTQRQINAGADAQNTPQGIDVDSSGNVHAAFVGQGDGSNSYDMQIIKYSSAGTVAWSKYGRSSPYIHYCNGIRVDGSGNVYVSGHYRYNSSGAIFRAHISKFNSAGTLQWKRMITHTTHVYAVGTAYDSAGNVYLLCQSNATGDGADMTLIKYNSSGTIQWQRRFSGTSTSDVPYAVYVDPSDYIYTIGNSNGGGTNGVQIAKYDSTGAVQWQRRLSTSVATEGHAIQVDGSRMYISGAIANAANDVLIAKLPSDGSSTGSYVVNGNTFTYAASSLTDAVGGLTDAADNLVTWTAGPFGVSTYTSTPSTTSLTYAKASV